MLDFATIIGLFCGMLIIGLALLFSGVDVSLVYQPEALLVVFGGTVTALLLQYSFSTLFAAVSAMRHALSKDKLDTLVIITYLYDAALFIREQGSLALEPILNDIEIPFLRDGFKMLIDNQSANVIRSHLNTKMDVAFQAEMAHVKIYESAAGFAPTMGILGAVIGLVKTLGTVGTSPELIGKGVASAFMATLFGVGLANLFLLPVAGKLAERARQTRYLKSIMLVGILSLERGENPALVREKLSAFEMSSARWDEQTVPQQDWQDITNHQEDNQKNSSLNSAWGRS